MTPLEFLRVVLPSPGNGWYCAAELSSKQKQHAYTQTLEDLDERVQQSGWPETHDTYFALAAFEEPGKRTADNARWMKALFIDIDKYPTKRAAAEALHAWLSRTDLLQFGTPYVVSSGGGLHVYWPLDGEIQVEFWKPVAENLKRLCLKEGLVIDNTVTADAARVLRYPGTKNHKPKYGNPRPVKVMIEGGVFSFGELASHIADRLEMQGEELARPQENAFMLPGNRPARAKDSVSTMKLFENSATFFRPIWLKTSEEGTGCAQLLHYQRNAAEDGMEPIWRGILSWTKVCEDGDEWAHFFSAMHPYDEARMQQKLREIKGPYACTKMDSENPGVCTACAHWGKITNPLALGREVQTETAAKVIELASTEEPAQALLEEPAAPGTVRRPDAPRGFSYGTNGGVYARKTVETADGSTTSKEVQVLPYDLFVVDMLKQDDGYCVHMVALRPEGPLNVSMPSKCVVSKDETVKFLASQNIIASYGQGNDKNLFDYVRACVEDASLAKRAVVVPTQCGWQKDGSFVYNYRVFRSDGREVRVPMPGLENINKNTASAGTMEGWRKFWDMMISRGMYTMLAMCLDSFGCPLLRFLDYEGFVWHIGSTESGTGKSLTITAKAGVWGHPVHYRTGKGTSPVAMQQRAGLLNSLPLLVDEITAKSRADMEWAPAFIFDITEGKGKERMESGANKERVNDTTWKLTCTMTSNTHLTDYMAGGRKHASNGELLRMLEWTPNTPLVWDADDKVALEAMRENYGLAGEAWVRWLVTHQELAHDVVRVVHQKLKRDLEFSDEERYWHAGCTLIVAAAVLLGKRYAGLLPVPTKAVVAELHKLVKRARTILLRSHRSADDILNAYTRENYGQFIIVRKTTGPGGGWATHWGDGSVADKSPTRTKVLGRVEHDTYDNGWVEYYIEEQMLKQHCAAMSFGYTDLKDQLAARYRVTFVKKNMLAGTGGPTMKVNAIHIRRKIDDVPDEEQLPVEQAEAG